MNKRQRKELSDKIKLIDSEIKVENLSDEELENTYRVLKEPEKCVAPPVCEDVGSPVKETKKSKKTKGKNLSNRESETVFKASREVISPNRTKEPERVIGEKEYAPYLVFNNSQVENWFGVDPGFEKAVISVKNGKSLTSKKGILAPGTVVGPLYFSSNMADGSKTIKNLLEKGFLEFIEV